MPSEAETGAETAGADEEDGVVLVEAETELDRDADKDGEEEEELIVDPYAPISCSNSYPIVNRCRPRE